MLHLCRFIVRFCSHKVGELVVFPFRGMSFTKARDFQQPLIPAYIELVLLLARHVRAGTCCLLGYVCGIHLTFNLLDFSVGHILHPLRRLLHHLWWHLAVHAADLRHLRWDARAACGDSMIVLGLLQQPGSGYVQLIKPMQQAASNFQ